LVSEIDIPNFLIGFKSFIGIPGNVLGTPNGSGTDVVTYTNVNVAKFSAKENKNYQVLMVRKLNTANSDDIIIDTAQAINFTIGLTDNDEINYIGKQLSLTFKYKY